MKPVAETRYGAAIELLPAAESGHGHDRWYELRNAGVTATDVAVLMTGQYGGSAFNLYWQKVADLRGEDKPEYARGRRWEATVGEMWLQDRADDKLVNVDGAWRPGLLARNDARWQLASPDMIARVPDPERDWLWLPVEVKTTATWNGWGADWSDEVPEGYRYQVLWQCHVLGAPRGYIAALMPNHEVRTYVIEAVDENGMELIAGPVGLALARAAEFYHDHLRPRVPPALSGTSGELDMVKSLYPDADPEKAVVFSLPATIDVVNLDEARAQVREAQKRVKAIEAELRLALGDAHYGTDEEGRVLVTRSVTPRAGYEVKPGQTDKLIIGKAE